MKNAKVTLVPLKEDDREQFILDNQRAFKYGAMQEFGERDSHFEEGNEIISRATIERSIDAPNGEAYRIVFEGRNVGGVVLAIDGETKHNHLELLFVNPEEHSRGIGYGAWLAVEALHPETKIWETCTPYFEKRNIHFYINKCKFHAVEYYCEQNVDPNDPELPPDGESGSPEDDGGMFRFEKVMK